MRRAASLLCLLFACSSPTTPVETPVDRVCREVNERVCAGLTTCGCRLDIRGYDGDGCVAARTKTCADGLKTRVIPDLDAGRTKVDEAAVKACRTAIDALAGECRLAGSRPLPDACNALFIDVAAVGESCRIEGGGLVFCGDGAGFCTTTDPRTCTKLPGAGEQCPLGFCGGALACVDGQCTARGATGATCTSNAGCAAGLACVSGKCGSPLQKGGSCDRTDACAIGLSCVNGSCADGTANGGECSNVNACGAGRRCALAPETRTCKDFAKKGELCATGDCAVGLTCDVSGVCIEPPEEGSDCSVTRACVTGFGCSDADQKCHRLPDVGETCFMGERFCRDGLGSRESSQTCEEGGGEGTACLLNPPEYVCADGFGCNFGANGSTCQALAGAGTACETSRTCSRETYCLDGQCAARKAEGAACPGGDGCAPGLSCLRSGGSAKCVKTPARGDACEFECTAGLACRGAGGRCAPQFCLVP